MDFTNFKLSEEKVITHTKLMLIGGYNTEDKNSPNFDVEVVNFGKTGSICDKPKDIPLSAESVGTFMQGKVYVCGGLSPISRLCFSYDNVTNEWKSEFSTTALRLVAASVNLAPNKWWIIGGFDGSKWLSSTDVCDPSSGCKTYLDLPKVSLRPRAVRLNESHIFILPKTDGKTNLAWIFDQNSEKFSPMIWQSKKVEPGIGGVNSISGTEIVVAGGNVDNTVEIYNFDLNQWRRGPKLNGIFGLGAPSVSSIDFDDGTTFIISGGRSYIDNLNYLFLYNYELNAWIVLNSRMDIGRYYHVSILIPDD